MSDSSSRPLVSVCIPTCNRSKFLRQAIDTVLSQAFTDFELIISDNASTDNTESVVRSFHDQRIRYVSHKANVGPIGNFNECLALAKGTYVTLFHDDDRMLPGNLDRKVRALDEHPRAGFVHSAFEVIDGQGNPVEGSEMQTKRCKADTVEAGHDFLIRSLLRGNSVCPPSVMLRRECYVRLGGFTDKVTFTTDYEYWMRTALYYDVLFLARPLIQYRKHADWGTSRYTKPLNGSLVPTLRAVEEEFLARQLVVERCKDLCDDWRKISDLVYAREIQRLDDLLYQGPVGRFDDPAERGALLRICRRRPSLIFKKPILRFLLKQYCGDSAFNALKNLADYLRWARPA